MTLESRLAQLQRQAGVNHGPDMTTKELPRVETNDPAPLNMRLRGIDPRRLGMPSHEKSGMSESDLAKAVSGQLIAEGVIRITKHIRLDQHHGNLPLKRVADAGHPLLDEGVPNHHRLVYLDTETTGLSGGSGTIVFLVGIALLIGDRLEITQLLLTRYSGEPALLGCLSAMLSTKDALVTYNGKSFDIPLLTGRYRINGMSDPFEGLPHVDLLHPVRRMFSTKWNDCRLPTAEQALLAFRRHDDLPGAAAPEAWFAYIRRGEANRLKGVCRHNALDVLSLPALRTVLGDKIKSPTPTDVDITALSRWMQRIDEPAALDLVLTHRKHLDDPGLQLLGDLLRRAGKQHDASLVWRELASAGSANAAENLAKYQEHVRGDLGLALLYASRLPASRERDHRMTRIRDKLNRKQSGLDFNP